MAIKKNNKNLDSSNFLKNEIIDLMNHLINHPL